MNSSEIFICKSRPKLDTSVEGGFANKALTLLMAKSNVGKSKVMEYVCDTCCFVRKNKKNYCIHGYDANVIESDLKTTTCVCWDDGKDNDD